MGFQIRLMASAEQEVDQIVHWIAIERQAPAGAEAWLAAYNAALDRLCRSPKSCPIAPESDFVPQEIRQVLFKTRRGRTYRALFMIDERDVVVLHVRGPRQNLMSPGEINLPD